MNNIAPLGTFDGRDILGQSIKITRAGDGLSAALSIEPREFHIGDRVYVVLETEVTDTGFKPVADIEGLRQIFTLQAGAATIVEEELVVTVLAEQRRKIDEAHGRAELEFPEFPEDPAGTEAAEPEPEVDPEAGDDSGNVKPIGRRRKA